MDIKNVRIKGIFSLILIVGSSLGAAVVFSSFSGSTYTYEVKSFSSYNEMLDFLSSNYENFSDYQGSYKGFPSVGFANSMLAESRDDGISYGGDSVDYSTTNVQVEGVDEPDIVKTDGTYLYVVSDSKIFILKIFPVEDALVLSEIVINNDIYLSNIFINGDRLVVFGTSSRYLEKANDSYDYWWNSVSTTVIKIFDISDRSNPVVIKDIEVDGWYFDSRMIGDFVYIIAPEYSYYIYPVLYDNKSVNIPEITVDDDTMEIPPDQIYYVDVPERIDTMTHILSINLKDNSVSQKSFLLGSSQTMYVSNDNIYLTYTKYNYIQPILRSFNTDDQEKTIIHKISIDSGDISYIGQGEVPGRLLNQFSMDEYNGFFRIATTIGNVWNQESSNNIFILDEDLNRISEIENIAPGESIYSSRFMGDRAYLVTFKKIDPFFTIDLSDPYNPEILGKLKIPGYSDYLHPYDEDHIIGMGKETVEAIDNDKETRNIDFAWYQGLKIALFDVSDFENPKEVSKIVIGDRGTDSPALYNHKAFLFDREKELLVIPVSLYEISDEIKEQYDNYTGSLYGEFTFQGAYVYRLTLGNGFEYKGRITHLDDSDIIKSGDYWYWGSSGSIFRSLYIDDVLYTISDKMVKMNDLETLAEMNFMDLM